MKKAPSYPTHKADALATFRKERRAHHENHPWQAMLDALVDAGVSPRMLRENLRRGTAILAARKGRAAAGSMHNSMHTNDEAPET